MSNYQKIPRDTRPNYVSITETRCGKECSHFQKVVRVKAKTEVILVAYKCEPNSQFWYPTDKVHDFFGEGCIHFKPKPSEAQK